MEQGCNCPGKGSGKKGLLSNLSNKVELIDLVDTTLWSNYSIVLSGDVKVVNSKWSLGTSAFACGKFMFPRLPMRNVSVTCNKVYNSDLGIDVTDLFFQDSLISEFEMLDDLLNAQTSSLVLNQQPNDKDIFLFTFQLEDEAGQVHETTTEPIIISP